MAIGQIPPWLNVQPAQFQQAYESGARTGLALAEMRDRVSARAESRALALEEMRARQAERQQAAAERAREVEAEQGLAREKMASAERIASERNENLDAYRAAQLDLREAGLGIQKSNLELAREKAETAAQLGDDRAALGALRLDLMMKQLDLAKERLEDARNKPAKEPTVTIEEVGPPTIRRSGPASAMEQFLPKPPPATEEPTSERGPSPFGRLRDFLFVPPIGRGPRGPDVLGPVLDLRGKEPARPQTQEEYDALPSGSQYYDETGKLRRKK